MRLPSLGSSCMLYRRIASRQTLCIPSYPPRCIDFTDVHVRGGKVAFAPAAAAPPAAGALAAVPAAAGASAAGVTGSSADTSAVIAPVASPEADASLAPGVAPAMCSQALVTVRWLGFRRIWRGTGEGEELPA